MSLTDLTVAAPPTPLGPKAYTVGMADDVPLGEGRAFVVGTEQVAVFRLRDGSLHATQAACPHAGGPLADGQSDLDVLVCPLHQYAYRWSDGASTSGTAPIRTYPVRERDGYLVVEV
jgi:nitrite reductase (NADH) small subunit